MKKRIYGICAAAILLAAAIMIFPVSAKTLEIPIPETMEVSAETVGMTEAFVQVETEPREETQPITEPTAAVEETAPVATEPVEEILPTYPETMEVEIIPALDSLPVPEDPDSYDYVPLYFQTDYPNNMYGSGTIADNGCSVTCLAMVATYMTDHEYLPDELARYFGGNAENNIERLENGADTLQLAWEALENMDLVMEALREGKVVVVLMESSSLFTQNQHFIVLTGINENGLIMVNDPYEPHYEKWDLKRAFQEGFTEGDILSGFDGAWAFDKSAMPEDPFVYQEVYEGGISRYPDVFLTQEELKLVAQVVWVEAQGECEEGQQAVAEVILNRLASEKYGSTVHEVIFGEGQFRSVPFLDEAEPYQAQYEAVERAVYGPYVLPENVVHFATFPTNDNVWGQIGGHIFCYESE